MSDKLIRRDVASQLFTLYAKQINNRSGWWEAKHRTAGCHILWQSRPSGNSQKGSPNLPWKGSDSKWASPCPLVTASQLTYRSVCTPKNPRWSKKYLPESSGALRLFWNWISAKWRCRWILDTKERGSPHWSRVIEELAFNLSVHWYSLSRYLKLALQNMLL